MFEFVCLLGSEETGITINLRTAWSTQQVPGQLGLHKKTISEQQQTTKTKKEERKSQRDGLEVKKTYRVIFQTTWVQFPAHTQQLTAMWSSGSMESDTFMQAKCQ